MCTVHKNPYWQYCIVCTFIFTAVLLLVMGWSVPFILGKLGEIDVLTPSVSKFVMHYLTRSGITERRLNHWRSGVIKWRLNHWRGGITGERLSYWRSGVMGKSCCLCRQGILGRFNHCRSVIMGRSLNYWKSGIRTDWAIIERCSAKYYFLNEPTFSLLDRSGVIIWRLNHWMGWDRLGEVELLEEWNHGEEPVSLRQGILGRFNHCRSGIINHWRSEIRTDWAIIERWVLETSF